MVEREKFKVLVKGMKAVYTQTSFIPDQDAFNVWYELLKDIPYEKLSVSIRKHMMSSPYPPTIADIRGAAAQLMHDDGGLSDLSAWGLVRKAVRNSNYHAEEEFADLPEMVQIVVGNPANLREWAMMPTETVESVEQSHFLRAYRAAVEEKKETGKLTPEIRKHYELPRAPGFGRIGTAASLPADRTDDTECVPMPEHVKKKMLEIMGGI